MFTSKTNTRLQTQALNPRVFSKLLWTICRSATVLATQPKTAAWIGCTAIATARQTFALFVAICQRFLSFAYLCVAMVLLLDFAKHFQGLIGLGPFFRCLAVGCQSCALPRPSRESIANLSQSCRIFAAKWEEWMDAHRTTQFVRKGQRLESIVSIN